MMLHQVITAILQESNLTDFSLSRVTPGIPGKDNMFILTFPKDFTCINNANSFLIIESPENPQKHIRLFNFLNAIMKDITKKDKENLVYSIEYAKSKVHKNKSISASLQSLQGQHLVFVSPEFGTKNELQQKNIVTTYFNNIKIRESLLLAHKPSFENQVDLYLAETSDITMAKIQPRLCFQFQNQSMAKHFIEKMKNYDLQLSTLSHYPNRVYIEPYNADNESALYMHRADGQTRTYFNAELAGKVGCA